MKKTRFDASKGVKRPRASRQQQRPPEAETLWIIHEASVIHHALLAASRPVARHEYLQLLGI